ncbi:MAG: phosphocholine cytidylyltransferase family protein [Gammaproteobacteria bacterium]|nr:phosphocholine cytidylyltransferase family protein [Gammaproteobacteria bacterium]
MRAVILAAGVGSRLGRAEVGPKCLLEFDDRSLLERHIDILEGLGVSHITIGVGFEAAKIEAAAATVSTSIRIDFVYNPDFREGNIVTLWHTQAALLDEPSVLLMDADVLYHPSIMARLLNSSHANCMLLDRQFEAGDEPVKICIDNGRIVEFRKQPDAGISYEYQGESVGFFKLDALGAQALVARTEHYMASGRRETPYEDALRDLVLANQIPFGFEDITGTPWIEIDFPEDISRAQALLPNV